MKRHLHMLALSAAMTAASMSASAFELGPWEQVLMDRLTPAYPSQHPSANRGTPTVNRVQLDQRVLLPDFAVPLVVGRDEATSSLRLEWVQSNAVQAADVGGLGVAGLGSNQRQFEQSVVMPGLTHQMASGGAVTISAVLASQRFANASMNLLQQDGPLASADRLSQAGLSASQGQDEVAHGVGVRIAWAAQTTDRVTLEAALQSRVAMTEFATVRGLHGSLAQLDIPSRMELGVRFQSTDTLALNASVSRVFYGEIGAFPSRALPARFGALLGDGSSPEFSWDDLTVLRLGWSWQPTHTTQVFMDYHTRTQPRPTAAALARALDSDLANNAFTLGVVQELSHLGFGRRSELRLSGAYAPPEYAFGGNVMGVVSDRLSQSTEVQLLFRTQF